MVLQTPVKVRDATTMKVTRKSIQEWTNYKNHPSESMENMINRILKSVYDKDEYLNKEDLKDIKLAMNDFEQGRYTSNKDLRKELGL
jgi:hypothetical protein